MAGFTGEFKTVSVDPRIFEPKPFLTGAHERGGRPVRRGRRPAGVAGTGDEELYDKMAEKGIDVERLKQDKGRIHEGDGHGGNMRQIAVYNIRGEFVGYDLDI